MTYMYYHSNVHMFSFIPIIIVLSGRPEDTKQENGTIAPGKVSQKKVGRLSLYSTVTQNTWRRGLLWAMSQTPEFCVGDTNMLVSCSQRKSLNLHYPRRQNLNFAFHPKRNPNASQWNIGCVGSCGVGAGIAGGQRKCSFQWNMDFRFFLGI